MAFVSSAMLDRLLARTFFAVSMCARHSRTFFTSPLQMLRGTLRQSSPRVRQSAAFSSAVLGRWLRMSLKMARGGGVPEQIGVHPTALMFIRPAAFSIFAANTACCFTESLKARMRSATSSRGSMGIGVP